MEVQTSALRKSELLDYLNKHCHPIGSYPNLFDCLEWWKINNIAYLILSKMAYDILAILITTIASEAMFNVRTRVIDLYQAALAPKMVQVLLCAGDWCRNMYEIKKKQR